jgi:acyl carrier protein
MNLTREQVLSALAKALSAIVVFKGRPAPEIQLGAGTDPAKALELDSDDLVLVGVEISDLLEVEVPEEAIEWIDDSSDRRRCRTLGEVADRILGYFQQEAAHG